tara:strand:- start:8269 stop:8556 length:288 start_codon:yes stop_codon:yes gene_type:complete
MKRLAKILKIAKESDVIGSRPDLDYILLKESAKKKRKKKKKSKKKRTPTKPDLWQRAIRAAKNKFEVYPSAYANGWALKWYKKRGGGWRGPKPKK